MTDGPSPGQCRRAARCWLVRLFLVNEQLPAAPNIDERWLFQFELAVRTGNGSPAFVGRDFALADDARETDPRAVPPRPALLLPGGVRRGPRRGGARRCHRRRPPVGHIGADGDDPPLGGSQGGGARAADAALHATERELLGTVTFDMEALSAWTARRRQPRCAPSPAPTTAGSTARSNASPPARQRGGVRSGRARRRPLWLTASAWTLNCWAPTRYWPRPSRFANHSMWQQRLHTLVAEARRIDQALSLADAEAAVSARPNWRWRPFQLAFMLQPARFGRPHPPRAPARHGHGRPPLLPDRRRQDRGVSRPDRLHRRRSPAPGRGRRPLRRRRGRRADALHASPADLPAVPASGHPHLRARCPPA